MFDVVFTSDRRLLIRSRREDDLDSLPLAAAYACAGSDEAYTYRMYGCECRAREAAEPVAAPGGCRLVTLREAWHIIPHWQYRIACKGAELLNLDRNSRFCGRCGGRLRRSDNGLSKLCDNCGAEVFPQISPCVIVLVRRGEEALLVHAATFRSGFYGLVAGYVETGETLEECVRREVIEETSLEIENLRYAGSQPWPNPANLMLGFTADYAGGELRFADGELTSGGFFSIDRLPQLPSGASIARMLINQWIRDIRKGRSSGAGASNPAR